MNLGGPLADLLLMVSQLLLYPVEALLLLLLVWVLFELGAFSAEFLVRLRSRRFLTGPALWEWLRQRDSGPGVPPLPARLGEVLAALARLNPAPAEVGRILQEYEIRRLRRIQRVRMAVRIGPSLGLLGTLIPISAAVAALSQGNVETLARSLIVAFTTTVVGLAAGTLAYFIVSVRQGWLTEDLRRLDYIADRLLEK